MNNINKNFGKRKVNAEYKTALVQDVFTRVSQKYDLMNDIMSFGFHRLWKKRLIQIMDIQTNDTVIDVNQNTQRYSVLPGCTRCTTLYAYNFS